MEQTSPEIPGYRFLGWGPRATGGTGGWAARPWYFGRCCRCGELLSMDPSESGQCACGGLYKDADYGRFGSTDGDASIAVYERLDYWNQARD
jgi:hypothetical protein